MTTPATLTASTTFRNSRTLPTASGRHHSQIRHLDRVRFGTRREHHDTDGGTIVKGQVRRAAGYRFVKGRQEFVRGPRAVQLGAVASVGVRVE